MPFLTPQYVGKKVGSSFLEEYPNTTKEDFMDEGEELSKQYREEHAQKRYLQGWERAFDERHAKSEDEVPCN